MRHHLPPIIAIAAIVCMVLVVAVTVRGGEWRGDVTGNVVASTVVGTTAPRLVLASGFVDEGAVVTLWDGDLRFDGGVIEVLTADLVEGPAGEVLFSVRKEDGEPVALEALTGPTGGRYANIDVATLGLLRATEGPGTYVVTAVTVTGQVATTSFVLA